jgi:AcrR family transcriptional regulator
MATIAELAGVGVGTLYRHFASREVLLAALTHQSFGLVLAAAQRAASTDKSAIECIRLFLDETIKHGSELVLPMHGGPVPVERATLELRTKVHDTLGEILRRGHQDRSIRPLITPLDLIVFGAMMAQPLPTATNWRRTAQRQSDIFLKGISATLT